MKPDTQKELKSLDDLIKDGYGYVINNGGKIIALITLMIAALVTFTNISFSAFTEDNFTVSLFVMLCASYVMYFSLEGSGEKLGEQTDDHISAAKRYNDAREKITAENIEGLRSFCLEYSKKEAEYRIKSCLCEAGISEEEYALYKGGGSVSKKNKRALRRCDKIKPARLTPALLLSREKTRAKSELTGPRQAKLLSVFLGLLPTTVGTFFTVSVILTVKSELSASAVMEGILKLSALPIIGFKGYSSGYSYSRNVKSSWLMTKAGILEKFLSEEIISADCQSAIRSQVNNCLQSPK